MIAIKSVADFVKKIILRQNIGGGVLTTGILTF